VQPTSLAASFPPGLYSFESCLGMLTPIDQRTCHVRHRGDGRAIPGLSTYSPFSGSVTYMLVIPDCQASSSSSLSQIHFYLFLSRALLLYSIPLHSARNSSSRAQTALFFVQFLINARYLTDKVNTSLIHPVAQTHSLMSTGIRLPAETSAKLRSQNNNQLYT